jgi:hypothetical protein
LQYLKKKLRKFRKCKKKKKKTGDVSQEIEKSEGRFWKRLRFTENGVIRREQQQQQQQQQPQRRAFREADIKLEIHITKHLSEKEQRYSISY